MDRFASAVIALALTPTFAMAQTASMSFADTSPGLAALESSEASSENGRPDIRLRHRQVVVEDRSHYIPAGFERIIVSFEEVPSRALWARLDGEGVRLYQRLGDRSALVGAHPAALERLAASGELRFSTSVMPSDKLSEVLWSQTYPNAMVHEDGRIAVRVKFYRDVDVNEATEILDSVGAEYRVRRYAEFPLIPALVSPASVVELASHDAVRRVSEFSGGNRQNNVNAADMAQILPVLSEPYNLSGEGVVVSVFDAGKAAAHPDFNDPTTGSSRFLHKEPADVHEHPTHVAGTIAGNGSLNGLARGMAPKAELVGQAFDDFDWFDTLVGDKVWVHLEYGVLVDNNSFGFNVGWENLGGVWSWHGHGNFGRYLGETEDWDDVAHDNPGMTIVKAAGNHRNDNPSWKNEVQPGDGEYKGGYDTISPRGCGKNLITVGGIDSVPAGPDSQYMAVYSSWGPCDSGRIKPDFVARGTAVLSTMPHPIELLATTNGWEQAYDTKNGTSMSCPVVSGGIALIQEQATKSLGHTLDSDTVRALLVATSDYLDGFTAPSYSHGYGQVDIHEAVDVLMDGAGSELFVRKHYGQETTDFMETRYTFHVPAGETFAEGMQLGLAWLEDESSENEGHLLHPKSFRVISPSGKQFNAWKLNKNYPELPATRAFINHTDNLQRIDLSPSDLEAEPGMWKVLVGDYFGASAVNFEFSLANTHFPVDRDNDGDGLGDSTEALLGTSVHDADSDFDSLPDGVEYHVLGTDPLGLDSDEDYVEDGQDNCPATFNMTQKDTDGDGAGDACDLPGVEYIGGDINQDGTIGIPDVQCYVLYTLSDSPPACALGSLETTDLNCDEVINVSEILLSIQLTLNCSTAETCKPAYPVAIDADQNNIVDVCEPFDEPAPSAPPEVVIPFP